MCGAMNRPAPFFIWHDFQYVFFVRAGSFFEMLRFENLEIHKVFLRFSTLPCEKISRRA